MKTFYTVVFLYLLLIISCKVDLPIDGIMEQIPEKTTPYTLNIPNGFPDAIIPNDNPMTVEGVELGRMLFFDPILSGDSTLSCAGCHKPQFAFSDGGNQFSKGIAGMDGARQTPTIINPMWLPSQFWDGRRTSLELQAIEPVKNPIEMNLPWDEVIKRLKRHSQYNLLFTNAFGTNEITPSLVTEAIAQFERTLISSNSKYDKVLRGELFLDDPAPPMASELRGFDIFFTENGDCFHCHGTPALFTDNLFHNNGLDSIFSDLGLESFTGDSKDRAKFKTPTLRNIEFSAPYMHDGRFNTLEEVVNFYSGGLKFSATIDPLMKKIGQGGLQLNVQEKKDLVAFLKTFSDSSYLNNPAYLNPFK